MNRKKWSGLINWLKYLPLLLCLLSIVLFFCSRDNLSIESLLNYSPESPLLAVGMLLLLSASKSLSVFFPMMVLQIVGGHLFSVPVALLVNTLRMVIILTLPYWIGRFSGSDTVAKLLIKYPKLDAAVKTQQNNCFFVCFFLRVISILPGDIVSMYFGATRTPFWLYLWASSLGTMPGVITSTLMGSALNEPGSPLFLGSVFLTLFLSLSSLLLHRCHKKKLDK